MQDGSVDNFSIATKNQRVMHAQNQEMARETVETLGGVLSAEANQLPCVVNGNILLRADGKIDIPKLGIKGMGRLSVNGSTDIENGLVQGTHKDKLPFGRTGVSWISYMTGDRAKEEADKQGLQLFSASEADAITNDLLAILGSTRAEQSKALQTLFGTELSGYWDPYSKRWVKVGVRSYVVVSQVDGERNVRTIYFDSHDTVGQKPDPQNCPQPCLACEEIRKAA